MKKINLGRKRKYSEVKDLDLAPMLSLMIAIIPVILSSTVLFKIRVFNSTVFPASEKVISQKSGVDHKPVTYLEINNLKSIKITIKKGRKIVFQSTKKLSQLERTLRRLKYKFPQMKSLKIQSDGKVSYKDLIQVFDIAKSQKDIKGKEVKKSLYEDVTLNDIFNG